MKQRITKSQWDELSKEGKEKFRKWAMGKNKSYPKNPHLSIGQMIEFLDSHKELCWHIEREAKVVKDSLWNLYNLGAYKQNDDYFASENELCDALWIAVKETYEKIS